MRKRVLPRETEAKEEAILSSGALTYNCTVPRSAIPLKQLICGGEKDGTYILSRFYTILLLIEFLWSPQVYCDPFIDIKSKDIKEM